jgi:hypothetical protein
MRRLDTRPAKKLRNPQRHIRSLARWPEWIELDLPESAELAARRYWAFKIPVFSKAVEPPHATLEAQRACFAALFAAAETVERSRLRPQSCRIAVLATTPFLFNSEVTLFADEEYFQSFLAGPAAARTEMEGGGWIETAPADPELLADLAPPPPNGLVFRGGARLTEYDPEWGEAPVARVNWVWAFDRH